MGSRNRHFGMQTSAFYGEPLDCVSLDFAQRGHERAQERRQDFDGGVRSDTLSVKRRFRNQLRSK
jgi:hypothetical protein